MFGKKKITLDKTLYEKAAEVSEIAGYSSVDEFIVAIIEREIDNLAKDDADKEKIQERLKGLGYI